MQLAIKCKILTLMKISFKLNNGWNYDAISELNVYLLNTIKRHFDEIIIYKWYKKS